MAPHRRTHAGFASAPPAFAGHGLVRVDPSGFTLRFVGRIARVVDASRLLVGKCVAPPRRGPTMTLMHSPRRAPLPAKPGDPELLRAVATGDPRALGELYDRYARDVWRAVRRTLYDAADVDDVVHAVFLALPRIAPSYDGRASCRGWLCGIGVRMAIRQRRGMGRFRRMLGHLAQVAREPWTRHPEREASSREELSRLERALARLSDKKRAAFVLVAIEGLSTEEAAEALEIPGATLRTRLFHARRELQAALDPNR